MESQSEPAHRVSGPGCDAEISERERAKWEAYYGSLAELDGNDKTDSLGAELAGRLAEFLPLDARLLEAGCGAGHQSLGLARAGFRDLTLMDFADEALSAARRLFDAAGVDARTDFVRQDALAPGEPDFDLVFNAGVLEHYTFDEQVRLLRGMASRSRRFVLALVPNRLCYWYWIWRVRAASAGAWPFGKEAPMVDLRAAFEAAGLTYLGQFHAGADWTENFIQALPGLDDPLRDLITRIHRGAVVPAWQSSYLIGALGSHGERPSLSAGWTPEQPPRSAVGDESAAILADTLALAVGAEQRLAAARVEAAAALAAQVAAGQARDERRRAEFDRQAADHQAELAAREAERATAAAAREAELAEREAAAAEREAGLTDRFRRLRTEFNELTDLHNASAARHAAELASTLADLDIARREFETLHGWSTVQAAQLAEITGGMSWKVLQRTWRLRQRVAPSGGLTARAARKLVHEGPGSLARAVARRLSGRGRRAIEPAPKAAPTPSLPPFGEPGLVSVVLPVYNQADLLPAAIESVLNQTYPRLELIVVNDGSSDRVDAVLDAYLHQPRVRLLTQPNQKLPAALSHGFQFARGEFWTWTSADNLMHPEQLARQVAFLRSRPGTAMVYADYLAIDDRGEPLSDPNWRIPNRTPPGSPEIRLPRTTERLNHDNDNFIGPCFLYRGSVGRLVGDYDRALLGVEDWDYWMRINAQFRIEHLGTDELLYSYRVHDNSLSGRAVELGIAGRALELLDRERLRGEARSAAWTVVADDAARARLSPEEFEGRAVGRWAATDEGAAAVLADDRTLLLVDAPTLAELAARPGRPRATVAAWFADPDAAYTWRVEAARLGAIGLAPDAATADRLELVGVEPLMGTGEQGLVSLALRRAMSRDATPDGAATPRALPTPWPSADRPLHVLIQIDDFLYGGLENAALGLAAGLDPARFRVTILVLGREGEAADRARRLGVRVVTLPQSDRETAYRRLLTDEAVDVVNAHYSVFGAAVAGALGLPFVQVVQNTYVWFGPSQIAEYRAADRHTTAYVCVSAEAARLLDLRVGLPTSKMIVLPNGADTRALDAARDEPPDALRRELGLSADDFVFLNVSQIAPTKAQLHIVQALSRVVAERPRAKVVMVGRGHDPNYLAWLDAEIESRGLGRAVVRTGHRDDAARFYHMADAFLLPSFWEGWSLALNEAVYAGLPVVATRVGGAADLIARVGGRLVEPPVDPLAIDPSAFGQVSVGDHPGFVAALAEAMRATCDAPARPVVTAEIRRTLDRDRINQVFAHLFQWVRQGGPPAAARHWADDTRVAPTDTEAASGRASASAA